VFLALVILFDFLRGLVFALVTRFELPVYMNYAIEWERALCGGQVVPVMLQQWRCAARQPRRARPPLHRRPQLALCRVSDLWSGVLAAAAAGVRRYALAVVLVLYVGELGYLLVPTVPPWMAAERFGVLPPLEHIAAHMYNAELPTLQKAFDINPIAAMPSLHAALPTLCLLVAISQFGWWALPMAVYTVLALFGILYLGEHYLVDALAGILLAAAAFAAAYVPWRAPVARPRWLAHARSAMVAVALIIVAEVAGALSFRLVRPFEVDDAFAARELNGRTPGAHLYLGRLALHEGDVGRARDEFHARRNHVRIRRPTPSRRVALGAIELASGRRRNQRSPALSRQRRYQATVARGLRCARQPSSRGPRRAPGSVRGASASKRRRPSEFRPRWRGDFRATSDCMAWP
jgi:membrane-associated phospholipid phosphatase